jgi:hypothetical protein
MTVNELINLLLEESALGRGAWPIIPTLNGATLGAGDIEISSDDFSEQVFLEIE